MHQIQVTYQGKPIEKSPFTVNAIAKPLKIQTHATMAEPPQAQGARSPPGPVVSPPATLPKPQFPQIGRVKVYGDGLKKALTNKPAEFVVDMRESGPAPLGIRIEGPVEASIDCVDNENGTCTCRYVAREPGVYQVHVLYNEKPVTGSPFSVQVLVPGRESLDVSRIRVYGPGVQSTGKGIFAPGMWCLMCRVPCATSYPTRSMSFLILASVFQSPFSLPILFMGSLIFGDLCCPLRGSTLNFLFVSNDTITLLGFLAILCFHMFFPSKRSRNTVGHIFSFLRS